MSIRPTALDRKGPGTRPLLLQPLPALHSLWRESLARGDGAAGAHCLHELWMRGETPLNIERMLQQLWRAAAESIPGWLPMRYVDWLPRAYEVAGGFHGGRGRTNLYLVLLDYSDCGTDSFGVYVGMSHYAPEERFDQHKAGIRAAGSVLRRGVEVLTGPVWHLQRIARADAARIEEQLAHALRAEGLRVEGGH